MGSKSHGNALIFTSGKICCHGTKSEDESKLACKKFAKIIQKLGFKVWFTNFKVVNMQTTCNLNFWVMLQKFCSANEEFCSFNPEIHSGLTFKCLETNSTLQIYASGKVV